MLVACIATGHDLQLPPPTTASNSATNLAQVTALQLSTSLPLLARNHMGTTLEAQNILPGRSCDSASVQSLEGSPMPPLLGVRPMVDEAAGGSGGLFQWALLWGPLAPSSE